MSLSPVKHATTDDSLPHDSDVEVDEDEASVKTDVSIFNGNSDNTSLLSEYRSYLEHGRRYQSTRDGAIKMPSDAIQYHSMEAFHMVHAILESQQPNPFFRSPISSNPEYILDLGTGHGQWCIDVADRFPSAKVVGVDLSPPPQSWIPANCVLEVNDYSAPWNYPQNQKFDLIHGRFLIGSVSNAEWKEVYREAYEHLAPGGWIERMEVDPKVRCDDSTMPADSLLARIGQDFIEVATQTEVGVDTADTMRGMIEEAGFTNVHERHYKVPIGPWPKNKIYKDAGGINLMAFKSGLEGWVMHLYTKNGKPEPWTPEQVHEYLGKVTKELDQCWHVYQYNRRVWAQKPFEAEGNMALKRRRPSTESEKSMESPRPPKDARELEDLVRGESESSEASSMAGKLDEKLEK